MVAPVLATDILPSLYDNNDDLEGTRESHEDVVDDLSYDIFNLAAFNYHSIRIQGDQDEREEMLQEAATRATQLLIKRFVSSIISHSSHIKSITAVNAADNSLSWLLLCNPPITLSMGSLGFLNVQLNALRSDLWQFYRLRLQSFQEKSTFLNLNKIQNGRNLPKRKE
jgi:hypothetical protein